MHFQYFYLLYPYLMFLSNCFMNMSLILSLESAVLHTGSIYSECYIRTLFYLVIFFASIYVILRALIAFSEHLTKKSPSLYGG